MNSPKISLLRVLCAVSANVAVDSLSLAGEVEIPPAKPDKSAFTLFHPTPRALMREMSTDRPDATESPYTVDAGHVQIESDLQTYVHDHDTSDGDSLLDASSFVTLNLKLGLCNWADFQLMLAPYTMVRLKDQTTGVVTRHSGFGNVTLRLKSNLWGNDHGRTAFGIMPFLTLPTAPKELGSQRVQGGVILPFAVGLPWGWDLGMMSKFNFNRDDSASRYRNEFVNSVTFGHSIVGNLSGYLELFTSVSNDSDSDWIATLDCGLTYSLTPDVAFDAGVNIGLTRSAPDVNPFLGVSVRF